MYSGILDTINNILKNVGVSSNTIAAVARAYASPSLANIRNVEAAFAAEGTTAPLELISALYDRYYEAIKTYPEVYTGSLASSLASNLPLLILGGLGLMILMKRR